MANDLFAASWIKVQRSKQFICELKEELERFRRSDPVHWHMDQPTETGEKIEGSIIVDRWDAIGLLPGAITGDAIHNMRTALDLMASDLARLNNEDPKNVYFPFARDETGLGEQVDRKNFCRAGQDAVELLRTFAPYVDGNPKLRAIHDLDIRDKHVALIPTGSQVAFEMKLGDGLMTVSLLPASIHYQFPPDTPFDGHPVIETLEQLVQVVEEVLLSFARLVAARSK